MAKFGLARVLSVLFSIEPRTPYPNAPSRHGVEAPFILVAFRRFAQFSDNERQRTHSGSEKACDYDHA
jgi:hypothetical protein